MRKALVGRRWFELRTAARAAHHRFNTRWTKDEALASVYASVTNERQMRRQWHSFSAVERHALQSLQAAGGEMPRYRFSKHYGTIRLCRQRPVEQIWHVPRTPAERLWLAGFIEIERGERHLIHLTWEGAAVLPPLPTPQPSVHPPTSPQVWTRTDFVIDLTVMIGALVFA